VTGLARVRPAPNPTLAQSSDCAHQVWQQLPQLPGAALGKPACGSRGWRPAARRRVETAASFPRLQVPPCLPLAAPPSTRCPTPCWAGCWRWLAASRCGCRGHSRAAQPEQMLPHTAPRLQCQPCLPRCRHSVILVSRRWQRVFFSEPGLWRHLSLNARQLGGAWADPYWQITTLRLVQHSASLATSSSLHGIGYIPTAMVSADAPLAIKQSRAALRRYAGSVLHRAA
jgi:hypothetical protein